jgi:SAM-dependent methyltransferase
MTVSLPLSIKTSWERQMHPKIYRKFEQICSAHNITGSVLEIGAIPTKDSLLCMKSLQNAAEKIGVNIDGPYKYRDFTILKGNANKLSFFDEGQFDVTLCNGVLEHDRFFWKTVSEIRRITKPGGLIAIGTPGYGQSLNLSFLGKNNIVVRALRKIRWFTSVPALFRTTLTLEVHNAPGDYYRFSPQAFREVLFEGMENVKIYSVMMPPIIIGTGTNP